MEWSGGKYEYHIKKIYNSTNIMIILTSPPKYAMYME